MVRRMVVQPPLLPRLATVSVLQRAVDRQPGSRARTRRAGAFPLTFLFKNQKISIFSKKTRKWHARGKFHVDRTLRLH